MGNSSVDGHAGGILAGCNDVALVKVEIVDKDGLVVPNAAENVTLTWEDGLSYLGGGNGDPASHVADKSAVRAAFHGLLLGVFGSTSHAGAFKVSASAPGLASATLTVDAKPPGSSTWWCDPSLARL